MIETNGPSKGFDQLGAKPSPAAGTGSVSVNVPARRLAGAQSRHSDSAKKMTSPSMLLSLDRPSPPAAAALLDWAPGEDEEVAVAALVPPGAVVDEANAVLEEVVVPLPGETVRVMVKLAGLTVDADVLGRDQFVLVDEQLEACATADALEGLSSFAEAMVAAPRAARRLEGRIWIRWGGR